jgi:hypothetical protein
MIFVRMVVFEMLVWASIDDALVERLHAHPALRWKLDNVNRSRAR